NIYAAGVSVHVTEVQKAPNGQNLHTAVIQEGTLENGVQVLAQVDELNRKKIEKNHTATHLLHQALKDVLGTHVNQAGSYVGPDRLRFDFSHFGQVKQEELEAIEKIVNEKIWANLPVTIANKNIDEAKAMGAMALFGEKYGEVVRVVSIGDYSLELCGGCHVPNSATIGLCKIVSESGIGAGTRRIEAVTSEGAFELMNNEIMQFYKVAELLKAKPKDTVHRTEVVLQELKELQRENESLAAKLANIEAGSILDRVIEVDGVKLLSQKVQVQDMNTLRNMADDLKKKIGSGIIVLGAVQGEKVSIISTITEDLIKKGYHAGKLVKEVATRCGGGGGGRPDMAQAGGKN